MDRATPKKYFDMFGGYICYFIVYFRAPAVERFIATMKNIFYF